MSIIEDRLAELDAIILKRGGHNSFNDGVCLLEAVAYVAGERHSDHPECVSPVIAAFGRRWNDDLDDEGRQRLKPYIAKMIGTRSTPDIEAQRGYMCADWLVHTHLPAWLRIAGLNEQADAVAALPPVADRDTSRGAAALIRGKVRDDAYAAREAARQRCVAAFKKAAWAAWAAGAAEAAEAAGAAGAAGAAWAAWAAEAAWAAWAAEAAEAAEAAWIRDVITAYREHGYDAAWDKAREILQPIVRAKVAEATGTTVEGLQQSAFDLLDRMIALGTEDVTA